jgi:hypothetical protein
VPGVMDAGFTLRAYAEYILDTPAFFTISEIFIALYAFLSIRANTASPMHILVNLVLLL